MNDCIGLDVDFTGSLSQAEFVALESDKLARDAARKAEKKKQVEKQLKLMAYVHYEDLKRGHRNS